MPPGAAVDPANVKPKVVAIAKPSGAVVLNWTKGKHDRVIIECKRGTETPFVFLDRDFKSPYVDTRPNVVAGVHMRTYRLRYEKDGAPHQTLLVPHRTYYLNLIITQSVILLQNALNQAKPLASRDHRRAIEMPSFDMKRALW